MQHDLLFHISENLRELLQQKEFEFNKVKKIATTHNPWFDARELDRMLEMVFTNYLNEIKLSKWLTRYHFEEKEVEKVVGIVSAGNIPLASFQDVWCALACGFEIQLKLSSKDEAYSKFIFACINELNPNATSKITFVDKLSSLNALIASGSNLTANHFKQYVNRFPCLVRAHRNGVALLSGNETDADLIALGNDVFSYYGLGCRNVTKLYIPDIAIILRMAKLFDEHFSYVKENAKYASNYDYQLAMLSLNRRAFYQSDTIYFHESNSLNSSISVLNYELYNSLSELENEIVSKLDEIQCVCSNMEQFSIKASRLGAAQWPELWDYQDNIDVIHFLQTAS